MLKRHAAWTEGFSANITNYQVEFLSSSTNLSKWQTSGVIYKRNIAAFSDGRCGSYKKLCCDVVAELAKCKAAIAVHDFPKLAFASFRATQHLWIWTAAWFAAAQLLQLSGIAWKLCTLISGSVLQRREQRWTWRSKSRDRRMELRRSDVKLAAEVRKSRLTQTERERERERERGRERERERERQRWQDQHLL